VSVTVSVEEFDRALAEGKIRLTRLNVRPVRCALQGCRVWCPQQTAQRVWVDGHPRGYLCPNDARGVLNDL
jgi:hypothetical protein